MLQWAANTSNLVTEEWVASRIEERLLRPYPLITKAIDEWPFTMHVADGEVLCRVGLGPNNSVIGIARLKTPTDW